MFGPFRKRALLGILAGLLAVTGGCTSESPAPTPQAPQWGPLAVTESERTGVGLTALAAGTLAISDECVALLGRDGEPVYTPVWGDARTRWDAEAREIVFEDPDRGEARVGDGDEVEFGGGSVDGDPDVSWVAEPHPSCLENFWSVSSVGGDVR